MRLLFTVFFLLLLFSCSTEKTKFKTENVCTSQALRYLHNPRYKERTVSPPPALFQEIAQTSRSMQLCYEDFKKRTGLEEFNTCLVVGVDEVGKMDFYNFGTNEVELDQTFLTCANAVMRSINYSAYGTNYTLIQSYQFYLGKK